MIDTKTQDRLPLPPLSKTKHRDRIHHGNDLVDWVGSPNEVQTSKFRGQGQYDLCVERSCDTPGSYTPWLGILQSPYQLKVILHYECQSLTPTPSILLLNPIRLHIYFNPILHFYLLLHFYPSSPLSFSI